MSKHYCGPVALAAATGVPVEEIEERILAFRAVNHGVWNRRVRYCGGKKAVRGTHWLELQRVAKDLGYRFELNYDGRGERLGHFLRTRQVDFRLKGRKDIVGAARHWLYVDGPEMELVDSLQGRISAHASGWLQRRLHFTLTLRLQELN